MQKFKKTTEKSINEAIQLILWRCRDSKLNKTKSGYYKLKDWINKIDNKTIAELESILSDIQYKNIGIRDS